MGGTESMQDIGPDMDDLLRRAAEGYPLKAPADNWDKIVSRLPAEQPAVAATERPKNKKRFFWLLLLLIPAAIGLYYAVPNRSAGIDENMQHLAQTNFNDQHELTPTGVPSSKNIKESSNQPKLNGTADVNDGTKNKEILHAASNQVISNDDKMSGLAIRPTSGQQVATRNNNDAQKVEAPASAKNPSLVLLTGGADHTQPAYSSFYKQPLLGIEEVERNEAVTTHNTLPVLDGKLTPETTMNAGREALVPKQRITHKKLYYGAMAGIGFSSVKQQALQKAGYDGGLFAGYRFTKNLALEAGVIATQKYYTTRGSDFNTNNLDGMMQPGMKMMEVEGSSQGISIPLHIKVDLNTKKGNKLFAKTGFSSFIMTKEQNFYHTMMNGNPELMKGIYDDNKNYFAASVDVAVGYEQNIQGKFYLRIEPYIQIPIKHVGVGDLPVTSAGLHVGISWPAQ